MISTTNVIAMSARRDDEPTPALLRQMVADNDDKHEEAHKRLRVDVRELQERADSADRVIDNLRREVGIMKASKPDASELRFPLPWVISLFVGFAGVVWSIYTMNGNLKDAISGLQQEFKTSQQVQGQQLDNLKETIQRLDRQQQLQYAEFQTFRQEMARRER